MYAYEIIWKEDGFYECVRGFKTLKQLNNFFAKLQKKSNVEIIKILDNVKGLTYKTNED